MISPTVLVFFSLVLLTAVFAVISAPQSTTLGERVADQNAVPPTGAGRRRAQRPFAQPSHGLSAQRRICRARCSDCHSLLYSR